MTLPLVATTSWGLCVEGGMKINEDFGANDIDGLGGRVDPVSFDVRSNPLM